MPDFKKNRFSNSSHRPFSKEGGSRTYGFRSDGPRELYGAECNSCHKRCQVPFRPNGKKPVYCADCFNQNDSREQKPRFEKREFTPSRSYESPARDSRIDDIKRQLDTMNATLQKLVATFESANRASEFTKEVRKHIPADGPVPAPRRKIAAVKKSVKKIARKSTKA